MENQKNKRYFEDEFYENPYSDEITKKDKDILDKLNDTLAIAFIVLLVIALLLMIFLGIEGALGSIAMVLFIPIVGGITVLFWIKIFLIIARGLKILCKNK